MAETRTFTASRCRLVRAGAPLAVVEGFSITKTIETGDFHPIGQLSPEEFPVTRITAAGSMESVVLVGGDPVSEKLVPSSAGTKELAVSNHISFVGEDIDIQDTKTKAIIGKIIQFTPTSIATGVPKAGQSTLTISFRAKDYRFESEV